MSPHPICRETWKVGIDQMIRLSLSMTLVTPQLSNKSPDSLKHMRKRLPWVKQLTGVTSCTKCLPFLPQSPALLYRADQCHVVPCVMSQQYKGLTRPTSCPEQSQRSQPGRLGWRDCCYEENYKTTRRRRPVVLFFSLGFLWGSTVPLLDFLTPFSG